MRYHIVIEADLYRSRDMTLEEVSRGLYLDLDGSEENMEYTLYKEEGTPEPPLHYKEEPIV